MTKQSLFKILFCSFILALSACKKAPICDCFEAAGSPQTETRTVPYFNQIVVDDNVNVFLSMGSQEQVLIEGGKNLTPNIATDVSGNVLTLKNNNICNWIRSYKKSVINVYITMPEVTYITNNGVGTIKSQDTITTSDFQIATTSAGDIDLMVNCISIEAHPFGSADVTLTGTCSNFECNFFAGTGFLYADHLNTSYLFLSSSTTGDCYVSTYGELDVTINQIGNVYYTGNPSSISKKISGSGQLIHE